jgi:Na+/melibiose symporter-like transporter
MALVIVLASWITGGDLVKALVIAALFFIAATAWGWRRTRARLLEDQARKGEEARTRP